MIEITHGDILKADTEALVNTVNCVGVMGRGIALQFKRRFPDNFRAYATACKNEEVGPGAMFVVTTNELDSPRLIINFPTKRHWRGKSRMEDIVTGLAALVREVGERQIASIAIPPLGCGLGGLPWSVVRTKIEEAFAPLDSVRVLLYEPNGAPDAKSAAKSTKSPKMTPGRAVLVGLMRRYLDGLMDPFVTLLEVHKLMYLMQECGEELRLKYAKAPLGPYAENLRHVFAQIEGHLVSGYADGGDAPEKRLELLPGAVEASATLLAGHSATLARFDRVTELVEGFETPFGLELLTSVHWVAVHDEVSEPIAAVDAVHTWNHRKKRFTPRQIKLAWAMLASKGWI